MILGEDCDLAGKLPNIKGRAIFRNGEPTEIQTFIIEPDQAEKMISKITNRKVVFTVEESPNMLPAR